MPIWDVVEGKWKSFKISKSIYFITSDELIKENKNSHETVSDIAEETKERKKQIIEEFRKRVQELKQKARQAKININGVNNENQA